MALCSFIGNNCRTWQENVQNQRHKAHGRPNAADLSRKPRHLPVIMKRGRSPNCGSVHHTAYYFTEAKRESQEKIHKNIKFTTTNFDKV
jgi:hypothetical protein